jgi:DNA invertase Pin-like site-specific DNA recombinase
MKGQKVGYIRVSTVDQNIDRQLEGLQMDRTFIDKFTGKVLDRPQFQEMMKYVREGDNVYVHSMDRLARNLMDLRKTIQELTSRKVTVHFIKENLSFSGEDSPMAMLLLSIMGAFAEFEVQLIRERQREGIKLARERGVYIGRKKILDEKQMQELYSMASSGYKKTQIASHFNISREAVYKYLRFIKKSDAFDALPYLLGGNMTCRKDI